MTKKELAQSICNLVGESNIRTIANCYTRVRLTVKDPEKMKREELPQQRGKGKAGTGLKKITNPVFSVCIAGVTGTKPRVRG